MQVATPGGGRLKQDLEKGSGGKLCKGIVLRSCPQEDPHRLSMNDTLTIPSLEHPKQARFPRTPLLGNTVNRGKMEALVLGASSFDFCSKPIHIRSFCTSSMCDMKISD